MSESLNCYFYKYTGDPRTANKQFFNEGVNKNLVYSCSSIKPIEALSDIEIRLIIDYPYHVENFPEQGSESTYPTEGAQKPSIMEANYVAIDKMWYQITKKERLPANALAIHATLDGVKSYWSYITSCPCICKRSGSGVDSFIPDPFYQTYSKSTISREPFDSSFSDDYQIVVTYVK